MAWTSFSAEAVRLNGELQRAHKNGQTSLALDLIVTALEKAHREGPSNQSYEDFEAELDSKAAVELAETGSTRIKLAK